MTEATERAIAVFDQFLTQWMAALREYFRLLDEKQRTQPPCKLCGYPIKQGQWVTTDGAHHECVEQAKLS